MYAYPSCFTDEMIKTLADCRHVVKYIDMPLQHINDQILHTMRRKVTRKQIETLLDKLRTWVPGITLRTTFISGFPGETEAQHQELVQFIQNIGFENVGVFEFSPEPGTPAGRLHGTQGVPSSVAARRKEEIMLAQQALVLRKNQAMVGKDMLVLIDSIDHKRKTAAGRHAGQAPEIDGQVLLKNCTAAPGELVQARIEDYNFYDLVGRVQSVERAGAGGRRSARISLPVMSAKPIGVEVLGKRG